jgi:hypothetical protein
MTIEVRIAADTEWEERRILTLSCDYPRFIHPQVMTYGLIRKSTSSSRAIPVKRQLELLEAGAFYIPKRLSKNEPGMGAKAFLGDADNAVALDLIEGHLEASKRLMEQLGAIGVHKQHANRYLEPFLITRCTMTASLEAFQHLIAQRDVDHEVQPEMRALAVAMREAIAGSRPQYRPFHIPYFEGATPTESDVYYAVARAARDSYLREDVSEEFMGRLKQLWDDGHLGPFEHVALFQRDFFPINALNIAFDMVRNDDYFYANPVPEGWRVLRHIGLDELPNALEAAIYMLRPVYD